MTDVVLLSNLEKPGVVDALERLRPWLADRARVVAEDSGSGPEPIDVDHADLVIVLGGDGTLLAQARRVVDLDAPIVGVNFGKLGFLAEFSLQQLQHQWEQIISGDCPISRRVMLDATAYTPGNGELETVPAPSFRSLAMNDCVITAGRPFRMIRLEISINPQGQAPGGTRFAGDGVIVASPSGSTAYNVSAGGPILAPDVDAMVITPICPQSLAFRPIVVHGDDELELTVHEANLGTTLVIDGQRSAPLDAGSRLRLVRHDRRLKLVTNPRVGYWQRLASKMHWAAGPRHGEPTGDQA